VFGFSEFGPKNELRLNFVQIHKRLKEKYLFNFLLIDYYYSLKLPCGGCGAKSDGIISRSTSESASSIIISITISAWTRTLKKLRVGARFACCWRTIIATTAILWIPKSFTRAFTRDTLTAVTTHYFQFHRTRRVQVDRTTRHGAVSAAGFTVRFNQHREIVTVDETDVEEIKSAVAVKCKLS
jgi:hypothetical protein